MWQIMMCNFILKKSLELPTHVVVSNHNYSVLYLFIILTKFTKKLLGLSIWFDICYSFSIIVFRH